MKKSMKTFLAAAAFISISATAGAYDHNNIVVGLGASNAFNGDDRAFAGNLEWRGSAFAKSAFLGIPNVSPLAGVRADTEGGTLGYAGLLYDGSINDRWSVVPSFAAGLYHEGDSRDLGGAFNFRAGLEVNYKVNTASRAGVSVSHITNFGIYDHNDNTQDVMATYSFGF